MIHFTCLRCSNITNNSNPKTLSIFFNEFNIISFKKSRIVLKRKIILLFIMFSYITVCIKAICKWFVKYFLSTCGTQKLKTVPTTFDSWCHSCVYVMKKGNYPGEPNLSRHPSKAESFLLLMVERDVKKMWSIRTEPVVWRRRHHVRRNTRGLKELKDILRWMPVKRDFGSTAVRNCIPPTIWQSLEINCP